MPTTKDQKILDKIKDDFARCEDYYDKDYQRNKEDTAFVLGDQWDATVLKKRKKFRQPCLTENRLLPFALKTINEIRKARPQIKVMPVDDSGDIDTAEIYSGVIRNIQYASGAENDYDTSALNAIMSARGFIKVGTKYVSPESFDQEITIDCVQDPFKAYLDPASVELDGSDAEFFIEYEELSENEFKGKFPGKKFEEIEGKEDGWFDKGTVRVVDYYCKNYETKTLYEYFDGEKFVTGFELPEGAEETRKRNVSVCSIKHYRVSGREILEENYVVGNELPIIPVYGLVMYKEGKRQVYSLVHQAKDPQRMLNYWKSASAEVIALQPKSPWVGPKGSFKNNPEEWARANIENIPFLEYEPVQLKNGQIAPAPQRSVTPQGSAIMLQESMVAADGIKAALGVYEASIGEMANEVSGIAIERRQMQGDNATYHFVDNLAASMRQVGKVVVNMIPEIYSDKRILRILGEDGTSRLVGVNQPVMQQGQDMLPVQGMSAPEKITQYDLEVGKYDVVVDIGATYATKRQETFALMKELMRELPQVAQAAPDLLVKSFDVQYADEIAERIRAVMDPALLGDDVEAERVRALATQLQDVSEQLEQAKIALQVKEDNTQLENALKAEEVAIKKMNAETDNLKTLAEIRKLEAQTQIEIPAEAAKDKADAINQLQGRVDEVVGVLDLLLENEEQKMAKAVETTTKEGSDD